MFESAKSFVRAPKHREVISYNKNITGNIFQHPWILNLLYTTKSQKQEWNWYLTFLSLRDDAADLLLLFSAISMTR